MVAIDQAIQIEVNKFGDFHRQLAATRLENIAMYAKIAARNSAMDGAAAIQKDIADGI
jgi:hypothetical protein